MTPDALKHARKVSGKGLESIRIGLNGAQILPDGTVMKRPDESKPPKVFRLLRRAHQGRSYRIGINAGYLKDLADLTLEKRLTWLVVLKRQLSSEHIQFLPWAASSSEKKELYNSIRAKGGEGIMLKRLDERYMQGGRPAQNWYKAKKSASFDCVVSA
jgi:hypothetical protein